ncbi:RNA polymerase sigma-70 factor, ECF subfamily [Rhizobiales bacterium GAS191]|nr:RNA polymerase sigma-70 factor, ECF subfamily [Rhizobiales bacterium GAS191]SEE56126.1 RNA polymerase sigma-70 factor, ECF subfamily [Rhizobiales bacterium GAS188]
MQVTTDEALIERIAAGDKLAMRALFSRHQVRVFRFLCGILRDQGAAEDVVNDVFIDVWRQAARFEGRSSVSTWVLAIARFKALSALRRPREAEMDEEAAAEIQDVADDPEVVAQKKDKGAILRACLSGLSAEHREIIDLVYYQEKSIEECAEIVDIPENTVKTRLFHARKRLAEIAKSKGLDRGWP